MINEISVFMDDSGDWRVRVTYNTGKVFEGVYVWNIPERFSAADLIDAVIQTSHDFGGPHLERADVMVVMDGRSPFARWRAEWE